jgi:uncharacterized membrane protein
MEYRVTATAGAPPAQVYRLFIDVERWPELTQSMRSVRRLDDGPIRVGSEAKVSQPRLPSARWRVTELEPDRRFTWQTSGGGVTTVGDHLVEPDGAGSRITLILSLRGPLSGVMGLLMGGIARRYAAMELEGFRVAADAAGRSESPGSPTPPAG